MVSLGGYLGFLRPHLGRLGLNLAVCIDFFAFRDRFLTIFRDFWGPPCNPSLKGDSSKNDGFFSISLECLLGCTSDPSGSLPDFLLDGLGPLLGAPGASWAASLPPRAAQDAAKNRSKNRRSEKKTPKIRVLAFLGASWPLLALSWPLLASSGTPPGQYFRLRAVSQRCLPALPAVSWDTVAICLKSALNWLPNSLHRSP